MTAEHFHKHFNLNVLGLLLASQAAAKHFAETGGSIINISSVVSTLAVPESAVYSGTKGAVDAITRSLGAELGPKRIRVNAIRPGMVETEGFRAAGVAESEMRKQVEAQTPLRRIGQPRDMGCQRSKPGLVSLGRSQSFSVMNSPVKIVVIGGSGLIGTRLVKNLRQRGHQVVAASPSSGVNTMTGEGLAETLNGAQVVVDVANAPSWEDKAVLDFFETSSRNLLAAEAAAGVKHHVALSVVGTERLLESG